MTKILALFGCLFIGIVTFLVFTHKISHYFLIYYLAISLVTYIVYAIDKNASTRKTWRIPENTLHLLELLGGWPAALLAMHSLSHKSKSFLFQLLLFLSIGLNLCFFSLFLLKFTNLFSKYA